MSTNKLTITNDSQVYIKDPEEVKAAATYLREALGFTQHDCAKALHVKNGNVREAAEYLADGGWMMAKLISWNWESLREGCDQLVALTFLPEPLCLEVLKKCGGNRDLAQRKLACLPALP